MSEHCELNRTVTIFRKLQLAIYKDLYLVHTKYRNHQTGNNLKNQRIFLTMTSVYKTIFRFIYIYRSVRALRFRVLFRMQIFSTELKPYESFPQLLVSVIIYTEVM